uniref:Importin 13 n=1 Tax=Myripristis murdjan TaxID=586833 RepID=A0A667Y366_9TELE
METCHGICRIAVTLGENHSRTLLEQVEHWQGFLALVNMIMFCTGIPGHYPVNETTSSLTLTFWYTLQDEIMSFELDRQTVYLQVYRPVYFQLVDVLLHKAQFPSDQEYASWSSDEKEQFRIYRVDISDTLMYVYEMLGAELLSNLYDKLGRLLTNTEQPTSWQHTEALLYGFQSIAETIDVNYSDVIPGLIGLIPRININNVQLADTVMFTIGALAEWLADHPVMLSSVLPLVLQALGNPDLSVSSVSTLKKICRECKYDLPPYATNIVAVSQEVLIKQIHKTSQCMWLMQALGFLLSALPVEDILRNLHSLITPYIQQLEKLADETPNPSNKLAIIHILGLLSNLFTTLDISKQDDESGEGSAPPVKTTPPPPGPNPVVVVLQQVFALIQTVLSKWLNDSQVVEAVCAIFEKSVKTLLHDFAPMVSQLSEMLGQMYSTIPQGIGGGASRSLMDQFAEVLFCLNKHCFALLSVWLKEALQPPGFPSSRVTAEQKDTFSQQILRERVNKRRVKDIVKEFTLVCRGLHGTEYAAEY